MLKLLVPVIHAVAPNSVYGMIRKKMNMMIPFNNLIGIEISTVGHGVGEARVRLKDELKNHVHTAHATLIFGVAEAASGAAMSGAIAPEIAAVKPVAAGADVQFLKAGRTDLIAKARTVDTPDAILKALRDNGKVKLDVEVDVYDTQDVTVAKMTLNWHVSKQS